jgi:23S rRNA pseudouridine2605 synthase
MAENTSPTGERIAKVLSRAGIASRREAERMIELGQVAVNGKVIDSPALNVGPRDRITVNGKPLAAPEPARLWLYYKPEGLVTSAADEKGRDTVFDHLPEDMPRVMSIGRLDLNSEGLLLLTNDGELKRRLELPSTGWLRKYRVRVKGTPTEAMLDPLRRGITIDGERFQPMQVELDRLQGANAWLTVGLREGKNREIRRAMTEIGLTVNRLIRISYGPFRLNELQPGEVEEVRPKVLRDQLGTGATDDGDTPRKPARPARPAPRKTDAKPAAAAPDRARKPRGTSAGLAAGLRELSDTWTKATTPRRAARPARDAQDDEPAPRRAGKAVAKPAAARKPAPRPAKPGADDSDTRPAQTRPAQTRPARTRPAAPGKARPAATPAGKSTPKPATKTTTKPAPKSAAKPTAKAAAKPGIAPPRAGRKPAGKRPPKPAPRRGE